MGLKINIAQLSGLSQINKTSQANPTISNLQPNNSAQNVETIQFLTDKVSANQISNSRFDETGKEKTVNDFLNEVLRRQPVAVSDENADKVRLKMKVGKSPQQTTREDYNIAFRRAVYNRAMDGLKLSDEEIKLADKALVDGGMYQSYYNLQGNLEELKANQQLSGNEMPVAVGKENIEYARRAGQAVLQHQAYQAKKVDGAIEKGERYATDALGGFVQPVVNAPVNIVNGISEPFRAGERMIFGTSRIPELPRMQIAERSEYWQKDNRMTANRIGEVSATITFGGAAGSKAIGTQAGRIFLGTESAYNIGAGVAGKDITQTDENGNARQMPIWERGLRVTGGVFGARQTIKTEISTPNSITNQAVDKLDDVFKNPPIKPQAEAVTLNGFRVKVPQNDRPLQTAEDLTLEMRGRGGYETNQVTDKLGVKMPKVQQPIEVTPSLKPNLLNKPLGESEKIRPNASPESVRGLTRQNETAEVLAKNGYRVEQKPQLTSIDQISNPWLGKEKRPDFKIEGEIFDAYSPGSGRPVNNIRDEIELKVQEGQTRRIVLNMDDSSVSLDELKKIIWEKPISELEQILVVKDGRVANFFPFKN